MSLGERKTVVEDTNRIISLAGLVKGDLLLHDDSPLVCPHPVQPLD